MQNNSWIDRSYPIFLYSGIVFFIIHFLIYGLGVDQSYFGLVLVCVGYSKIGINGWILGVLWIGLVLEGLNLGNTIYERYLKPKDSKKKYSKKQKNKDQKQKTLP